MRHALPRSNLLKTGLDPGEEHEAFDGLVHTCVGRKFVQRVRRPVPDAWPRACSTPPGRCRSCRGRRRWLASGAVLVVQEGVELRCRRPDFPGVDPRERQRLGQIAAGTVHRTDQALRSPAGRRHDEVEGVVVPAPPCELHVRREADVVQLQVVHGQHRLHQVVLASVETQIRPLSDTSKPAIS